MEEGSGVSTLLMFLQLPSVCLLSEGKHASLFPLSLFGKETAPGLCRTSVSRCLCLSPSGMLADGCSSAAGGWAAT